MAVLERVDVDVLVDVVVNGDRDGDGDAPPRGRHATGFLDTVTSHGCSSRGLPGGR